MMIPFRFSHSQDEIIYQEARRLVAAEMQNVVYGEYLPTVLGVDYMQRHGLIVEEETRYDDSGPHWRYHPYDHMPRLIL